MCIHRSISNTYELFHLTRLSLVCMGFEFVLERISTGFFFLFSSSLSFFENTFNLSRYDFRFHLARVGCYTQLSYTE